MTLLRVLCPDTPGTARSQALADHPAAPHPAAEHQRQTAAPTMPTLGQLDARIAAARTRRLKAIWIDATIAVEIEDARIDALLEQRTTLTRNPTRRPR